MKLSKKTIILTLFVMVFGFSFFFTINSSYFKGDTSEILEFDDDSNLKGAEYWNLTGAPIFIDGSNPSYNWSKTAAENDWCNGNGSLINPYIIENVTINAANSPTGCGIYINNSQTDYFTIKNVTVYNAGNGIKLVKTKYGTLMRNNCSYNIGTGIYLENSNFNILSENNVSKNIGYGIYVVGNNNTISGNSVYKNTLGGIRLEGNHVDISAYPYFFYYASFNNIISGNTVNHNYGTGIWIEDSHTNTISENIANNNTWDGIMVWGILHHSYRTSYNNTVIGNTANNNSRGIVCVGSRVNTISENTANYNKGGIHFYISHSNTLSGNTASYNIYEGVYISQSVYNTISGNTVNNNTNGIELYESDHITISGNIVNNNTNGIELYESDQNIITGNKLIGNNVCIIEVNCQENTFSNNGDCTYGQQNIISGYNFLFLFGILSAAVVYINKKIRKTNQ